MDLHTGEVVEGMPGIRFVHQLLDIKQMTNMSDIAIKMVVKWLTTMVLRFTHSLPSSWFQFLKVANTRSIEEVQRWQCWKCQLHSWPALPEGVKPEVADLAENQPVRHPHETDLEYEDRLDELICK